MNQSVLDNPAWEALNSLHANFAYGTNEAKRYRYDVLPFTGCKDGEKGSMITLDDFIARDESFYIIGEVLPVLPARWAVEYELPCAQMVLKKAGGIPPAVTGNAAVAEQLGGNNANEMFDLINTVQPGYYNTGTRLLGSYLGIRQEGRLVAMAGERMRLPGFSELSAICTLTGYTGRGYAQQLIAELCQLHAKNNIVSFLHVALTNQRAIGLYEHMGFYQRRTIIFRKMKKW